MDGRWFDTQHVVAHIATGAEKFKKSNTKKVGIDDDDEDEAQALDKFGSWLEAEKK